MVITASWLAFKRDGDSFIILYNIAKTLPALINSDEMVEF